MDTTQWTHYRTWKWKERQLLLRDRKDSAGTILGENVVKSPCYVALFEKLPPNI